MLTLNGALKIFCALQIFAKFFHLQPALGASQRIRYAVRQNFRSRTHRKSSVVRSVTTDRPWLRIRACKFFTFRPFSFTFFATLRTYVRAFGVGRVIARSNVHFLLRPLSVLKITRRRRRNNKSLSFERLVNESNQYGPNDCIPFVFLPFHLFLSKNVRRLNKSHFFLLHQNVFKNILIS